MKPSEAIRQRAAELFRERYMIAMPCMAPGEEAILEWIDAYTADQAGKRPGDPDTIAYNDLCDCGHIWGRHSSFSRCCNDGGCNCMLFEMRIKPDETPLYIPTAAETVRVVEVAPFDDDTPVRAGEVLSVTYARRNAECATWIILEARGFTTWCRVEPVCQCGPPATFGERHPPDCKWLKWIESKRVAPVIEPAREPLHIHGDDAPVNQHDLDELLAERDTALAEVERLEREMACEKDDAGRAKGQLEAVRGYVCDADNRTKEALAKVRGLKEKLDAQRIDLLAADAAGKFLDAEMKKRAEKIRALEAKNAELNHSVADMVLQRDQADAARDALAREMSAALGGWLTPFDSFAQDVGRILEHLVTVERERDELLKMPSGKYFEAIRKVTHYGPTSWAELAKDVAQCWQDRQMFREQLSTSNTERDKWLTELRGMYAAFSPASVKNPGEARQHIENLREGGKDEALAKLAKELYDANAEAERLRSELETARQRLAEGVEVMNARQVADREEIARLKGELASAVPALDVQKGLVAKYRAHPPPGEPIPMFLTCPKCNTRHIDAGEFATRSHHTHSCQDCGLTWRPAVAPTVGVEFLPGFKNDQPAPLKEIRIRQTWRRNDSGHFCMIRAYGDGKPGVRFSSSDGGVYDMGEPAFRQTHTFVSDPPTPATVAGEECEHGASLTGYFERIGR